MVSTITKRHTTHWAITSDPITTPPLFWTPEVQVVPRMPYDVVVNAAIHRRPHVVASELMKAMRQVPAPPLE